MASLFDNEEYKAKKREIKDNSIKAGIIGSIAALAFMGAAAAGMLGFVGVATGLELAADSALANAGIIGNTALAVGGAGIAGSAVLGVGSFVLGIKAQRLQMDANMDMEDLEAQRHAKHLQMAFGDKDVSKDTLIAYEAGRQRSDNKSWGDNIREQQRSQGMDPNHYR